MSENKTSCDCRKVERGKIERPGDYYFTDYATDRPDRKYIHLMLPGEEALGGYAGGLPVIIGASPPDEGVWGWNGSEEHPTLTPSIWRKGVWHGFLTGGRLISCP